MLNIPTSFPWRWPWFMRVDQTALWLSWAGLTDTQIKPCASRGVKGIMQAADRQTDFILLALGSIVNHLNQETGILLQISEGTWEISRGHLPIGIWKGPGSILEGTQPATKEVNTSVFLAAQDVIQWHTNTEMTPKIWGQIYLYKQALIRIHPKIRPDLWSFSGAYLDK